MGQAKVLRGIRNSTGPGGSRSWFHVRCVCMYCNKQLLYLHFVPHDECHSTEMLNLQYPLDLLPTTIRRTGGWCFCFCLSVLFCFFLQITPAPFSSPLHLPLSKYIHKQHHKPHAATALHLYELLYFNATHKTLEQDTSATTSY